MIIRQATAEDNEQLCAIMEQVSMGESFRLVFERSPDYFVGAGVQAEEVEVYVLVSDGIIEGLFSVGKSKVYFNGEVKSFRYLCDLRLSEEVRGGTYLARGYKFIKQHLAEEGEIMQSLILEDNEKTMDMLTSKRSFLPNYTENARYVTHILRAKKRKNTSLRTRNASVSDIPRLQQFYDKQAAQYQFAPVVCFSEIETSTHFYGLKISDFRLLEKHGEILAMTAVWDQSAFKRTKVVFYARWIRCLRPLLNPFLRIPLPREGESIVAHYLFAFYVYDNDAKLAKILLDDILQELPNKALLFAGVDEKDPLQLFFNTYRGRREYGKHYVVCYDDEVQVKGITKFEIARI